MEAVRTPLPELHDLRGDAEPPPERGEGHLAGGVLALDLVETAAEIFTTRQLGALQAQAPRRLPRGRVRK